MSVTRYGINAQGIFTNLTDGGYVSYQDYEKLAAENAGLKAAKEIIRHLNANREEANFCGIDDCYIDDAVAAMITPETDTFLAEVRASGVEMFADSLKVAGGHEHPYSAVANEFAAEIRKGVQS
ncbi:hypothetical protein [Enterobacter sp. A103]|uniref:hypothetical protein n=1 Tax=Enterobacter sp. A103 TaxID=3102785 RepID=UPI002ACA99A3|nr:hypothetical protein [Enterobacter sp. A103]MDZ5639020.1 hypothetical protein [Enterobacter sp. A103]